LLCNDRLPDSSPACLVMLTGRRLPDTTDAMCCHPSQRASITQKFRHKRVKGEGSSCQAMFPTNTNEVSGLIFNRGLCNAQCRERVTHDFTALHRKPAVVRERFELQPLLSKRMAKYR